VGDLERCRLVTRSADPAGGRGQVLTVTAAGRGLLREAAAARQSESAERVTDRTDADLAAFASALQRHNVANPGDAPEARLPGTGGAPCQGDRRVERQGGRVLNTAPAVLTCLVAAVLGLVVGRAVNGLGRRIPARVPTPLADLVRSADLAVRPPVVEVAAAVLFVVAVLRFGISEDLPAFLWLTAAGLLLSVIDLQHRLLPNRVVLPALLGGAVLLLGSAASDGSWGQLVRALQGAGALFGVFLVLALISPAGLGMGDVKLAGLLGLYLGWIGWGAVLVGGLAGFVVQAVVVLGLLVARRVGRQSELPFGPALLVGAGIVIVAGNGLVSGLTG
jgi:leader peptidase (prepilin peptidase)/N-methyltransferase